MLNPNESPYREVFLSSDRWKREKDIIINFYIREYKPRLRFVLRDGKRILQQECSVKATFDSPVYFNGRMTNNDVWDFWLDVPLEEENARGNIK